VTAVSSAPDATPESPSANGNVPLVALVGPPNAGKTTLFNRLTGLRHKVANYPGVTVERRVGTCQLPDGRKVEIVDLPGVNSFSARTLDEQVTRDVLHGEAEGIRAPDAVLLIVDSTRLEPHLMLVEPTLDLGLPSMLALNMWDELEERDGGLEVGVLGEQLGLEAVPTVARTGVGMDAIHRFLAEVADRGRLRHPAHEKHRVLDARTLPVLDTFTERRQHIRELSQAANFRPPGPSRLTRRLDSVFLHRVWGPVVFIGIGLLVFQAIFTWATPFMDGIEVLIASSGGWLASTLPDAWYRSLLVDGVWAGVGSVIVFLPQILILFLFLGILEDSGYMARAAVIADRLMYRVGLQGRAFLPLLSAYACAVPAILAARTVGDERDRLTTMFVAPFMTCSARLPVYALLIAAFIPEQPLLGPLLGTRAATLLGLYALGALAAIVTAFLIRRTLLRGERGAFVMEMPPYRVPSVRSLATRLWDRSGIFLKRAGKIIFMVTVILWGLTQVPRVGGEPPPFEESVLAQVGQVMEPAIEPLGFNWKIGVGLVSSLAAREVIVGTLGTIYGVEEADEGSMELQANLKQDLDLGGAIALLIFFVFALQCMSTVAIMKRETAGWKWPIIQWSYMLALAYGGAFLANWLI
jgi:ferrous iron transport protein B